MQSIGYGLIGTGFMGKCHALAMNAVKAAFGDAPRPRLVMLCDNDEAAARKAAEQFGFESAATDWRQLIENPAVQLVSITSPNGLHRDMAVAALQAGKHVWCEKPMALTLADAEAMAAAARHSSGKTLLGYNYLQNPAVRHMKALAAAGVIGRVFHVRGQFDEDYLADAAEPWSWRQTKAAGGLGVLGDLMCHLISLVHDTVSPIARLTAGMQTVYPERGVALQPGMRRAVENEDSAQCLVTLANGADGVLMASRAAWGRKNMLRLELHGTLGLLVFDQERMNELELFTSDGNRATRGARRILTGPEHPPYGAFCPAPGHQLGFNDLKVIEAKCLLDVIAGKAAPHVNFAEGLKIEKVIHAIAQSAAAGGWISL